jgi:predicted N-acetyltransferase YhbS
VEHCAQTARLQGAKALYVLGNPHAFEFYKRCGFEVLGTEETRFGSGLRMRKMLS